MSGHELPPGVPRRGPVVGDPDADEARGLAMLAAAGRAIVEGVDRCLPSWVASRVAAVLDAWGRADGATRDRAREAAVEAGEAARRRVGAELAALLAADPAEQRATPLEVVRRAVREPTAVLAAAGVPEVVREPFDVRAWPDDVYGLVPRTLGDLGDPDLGPLQLAWGVAKATVLRARAARGG